MLLITNTSSNRFLNTSSVCTWMWPSYNPFYSRNQTGRGGRSTRNLVGIAVSNDHVLMKKLANRRKIMSSPPLERTALVAELCISQNWMDKNSNPLTGKLAPIFVSHQCIYLFAWISALNLPSWEQYIGRWHLFPLSVILIAIYRKTHEATISPPRLSQEHQSWSINTKHNYISSGDLVYEVS